MEAAPQNWQTTRKGSLIFGLVVSAVGFTLTVLRIWFFVHTRPGHEEYYWQLLVGHIFTAAAWAFMGLFQLRDQPVSCAIAARGLWLRYAFGRRRFIAWESIVDAKRNWPDIKLKVLDSRGKRHAVSLSRPLADSSGVRSAADRPPDGHPLRKFI
jgi:hypothetical protein